MALQGAVSEMSLGRINRLLMSILAFFAPIFIKPSYAQTVDLLGKEPCSLCSDEGEVGYPDATIPFFFLPGFLTPKCSDLAVVASTVPRDNILCAQYQANAGYCGCPGAKPLYHCTFCPNGDIPSRSEHLLPTGDTCKSLHTYVSFFGETQCASLQFEAIANKAYDCGCEISMSEVLQVFRKRQRSGGCTLCSDGSSPPEGKKFLELTGMTCEDYAAFIESLDPEQCQIQTSRGIFDLFAYQCKCPGTTPPICPKQENPGLCTVSLLESAKVDTPCECYSFCDGEFVGCDNYPGDFLGDQCPKNGVSGCNYASAIDDLNGSDDVVNDPEYCYLCPDQTNDISNSDAILPPFSGVTIPGLEFQATCQDLIDYISTQDSDDKDCQVAKVRLAYYCGCKNVEPNCTLCPGGIEPSYASKVVTGDATCEEFSGTVLTWESGACDIGKSYLSIMAARCGCVSAQSPVCPVQENPLLCTINLLRSTNEDCECYNFCGDKFHSCVDYPGYLGENRDGLACPGGTTPIAGCNHALATSQRCRRGSIGPGCDVVETRERKYIRRLQN
mmetsp:Transcript_17736/g.40933  ORF Transcript_17736/g.40933 Transcript_17736/m.40933 type:complete len:558 (+) Transcript_17736:73-1746(+)